MCGISGLISLTGKHALLPALQAMNDSLRHRGPDDAGFLFSYPNGNITCVYDKDTREQTKASHYAYSPNEAISTQSGEAILGFGHRRLAIVDIEAGGHQPMCTSDKRLWITYNGEIYNYLELKEELIGKGYQFQNKSDTEVILNAYLEWGENCLHKFNGMWAFVIWDRRKNRVFGARDRFGVKPFYYCFQDHYFAFASEQKALLKNPYFHASLNEKAAADFFAFTEIEYQEKGLFNGIFELFPAHFFTLSLDTGVFQKKQYYQLEVNQEIQVFQEKDYQKYTLQIRQLFRHAIEKRLRADVEVGTCLSGGIDSACIAGTMEAIRGKGDKLHLYTAIFPGKSIDESHWAKEVVDKTGGVWHTIEPQPADLSKSLEDLIYSQDLPLWSTSTFAQYSVMKLVHDSGVKVVLDGQGGDELFGGYLPYFPYYWNEVKRTAGIKACLRELTYFQGKKNSLKHWTKEWLKKKGKESQYSILAEKTNKEWRFLESQIKNLALKNRNPDQPTMAEGLNSILAAEFVNTRLKGYLKCEDRCGMRWSVESRTPFADDIELINAAFQIPGVYKMRGGFTKSLLRDACQPVLPDKIHQRKDKMGYVTPNDLWLSEIAIPLLREHNAYFQDYVCLDQLEKRLFPLLKASNGHLSRTLIHKEHPILFKTLSFALWRKIFKV